MLATQIANATKATPLTTATNKSQQQQQQIALDESVLLNGDRTTPIKMERRESSTSESSLEHLDLGRTPTKLNSHTSATSTPHNNVGTLPESKVTTGNDEKPSKRLHDSDEARDYDDEEDSTDEKQPANAVTRPQRHHKRRSSGRLDKRTSVQLEYNADNPHSLRKKFRFNRSGIDNTTSSNNNNNNNESGFVDASSLSQYLNNSSGIVTGTSSTNNSNNNNNAQSLSNDASPYTCATTSHSSSSASSSPHGAVPSSAVSSPESGIGEREDMKYVCPICEVVSATPHAFTNHIRCHNYSSGDTENFTCRICSKVLSSASSLDRHVLVHTGERPFNCKYCHLTFTTNGNMHRHMRTHKQHQHNHHHRRNSNGTAKHNSNSNNNNNVNNNNNNNNSNNNTSNLPLPTTATTTTVTTGIGNSQSNNGNGNTEGVKVTTTTATPSAPTTETQSTAILSAALSAAAAAAAAIAATKATTTATTPATANSIATVNGKYSNGSGVESYESDGGCSTDSSSAISQSSNTHNLNENNNNNNAIKNNNNNNDNDTNTNVASNTNHNNNNNNNNNNTNTNYNNNFKRKISVHLDADDDMTALTLKRRVKTTINNNIIVSPDAENLKNTELPTTTTTIDTDANIKMDTDRDDADENADHDNDQDDHAEVDESVVPPTMTHMACPVCNADDFDSIVSLSAHMDNKHPDIPAKCRQCNVIFRTHQQLITHTCSPDFKPNFTEWPQFSELLREQILRLAITHQCFDCLCCKKSFSGESGLRAHLPDCLSEPLHSRGNAQEMLAMLLGRTKQQRRLSEGSAGLDEPDEDEDEQQEESAEFMRERFTKRETTSSPHLSHEDVNETAIKYETDGEAQQQLHNSLQSHDSKDLADIQSILNMTSSSSTSNFLKNFEQSVNTPSSSYSLDKDEEEAQDTFTSEFRKMKLRGEFPCKLCVAVFPNLRALKGHNRVHLSSVGPAGPFRCNMCPYSICDKAALVRHMRTHNGDRPYECAVCNYAFTTKANCERHLRNRHAKTTRDEVKRAIIYHPSEDSSCDDPAKKLHMYSSLDFDDDDDYVYQQQPPKDRSTPVSHLKEMLTGDTTPTKPMKIQVKRLDQLIEKQSNAAGFNEQFDDAVITPEPTTAPIDLSMDVLDLSKKPNNTKTSETKETPTSNVIPVPASILSENSNVSTKTVDETDGELSKTFPNLAQQQFMNDVTNPYLQFYPNLLFPTFNPFLFQKTFLPDNLNDLQKIAPLISRMFGNAAAVGNQISNMDLQKPNANGTAVPLNTTSMLTQLSPHLREKCSPTLTHGSPNSGPLGTLLPKTMSTPPPPPNTLNISRNTQMPSTMLSNGPVKMVIKNGVLMPKQKQRRYRTERPFACEHCSARFTLRSNMERHVKQQHPQFYAQRQRSGQHIMRGRGASNAAAINSITHLQAAFAQAHNSASSLSGPLAPQNPTISEQVKYAILAQQLKSRKDSDTELLQQALAHGSGNMSTNAMLLNAAAMTNLPPPPPQPPTSAPNVSNSPVFNFAQIGNSMTNASTCLEDDEPKLVIDMDEDDDGDDDDVEEVPIENKEEDIIPAPPSAALPPPPTLKKQFVEKVPEVPTTKLTEETKTSTKTNTKNDSAKKMAETILEQAIKAGSNTVNTPLSKSAAKSSTANALKSMIAQAESVGKSLKDVASSPFKDESTDLVPVSKLVDNATSNTMTFNNYFRSSSDVVNHMEQSDEEGLVASGSASESNNSGTEDVVTAAEPKKKSAYSLAPNRVSCPYCQRMFPWSSSLRRHILTHTGQKPFKCSHCPLLFTTKSNCDRHLLRKHGDVESAMSVYMPAEDVNEPIPVPKSVEEIEQQQRQREEEERKRKSEEARLERERREKEQRRQQEQQQQQKLLQQLQQQQQDQEQQLLRQIAATQLAATVTPVGPGSSPKLETSHNNNNASSSDLPFKCHLCESSFGERVLCLEHIKAQHIQEFALLFAKGAIDSDAELNSAQSLDENERRPSEENGSTRGKYPDYSNRKVICAFCMRRFWSNEDLRRHMRTHTGERPFQCEFCLRKFTLKHSMLRHMKKHSRRHLNGISSGDLSGAGNSGSDFSDDEQPTPHNNVHTSSASTPNNVQLNVMQASKIQELLNKANEWRNARHGSEQKENLADDQCNNQSDLIGNLLGISDQGILNKLLSSPNEAAKLLGVDE